ncbi:hypothetical protein GCM10009530_06430 [Microbispora corallina]|uniref:DUF4345 domain-containing protein n=1 Tax=Microbispora corallina TaxID=83302 RepID=A0ABQ4FUV8_9ACTN|nr:hypothetical protein [Microbispora corallina]GIH38606.1 hypothetical protein Mco01_16060 [Microbispora corallina]
MTSTIERTIRVVLVLLGVITALPALALVSPRWALGFSYGIPVPSDPMAAALLQHRGVLQAALGAALVWAAFAAVARVPAAVTAIVTKSVFLALMAMLPADVRAGAVSGIVFDGVAIVLLALIVVHRRFAAHAVPDGLSRASAGDRSPSQR